MGEQGVSDMYGLIGKMIAVAGQRDTVLTILFDSVGGMPNCLSYIIAKDSADENALWITERVLKNFLDYCFSMPDLDIKRLSGFEALICPNLIFLKHPLNKEEV